MSYGVAGFDSAAAMLTAAARVLDGKDFPALGHPKFLQHIVRLSEIVPTRMRRAAYAAATGFEAIPQRRARRVSTAEIAGWAAGLYPERSYPVAFVGSSSGALVHLAAALDAPWLPQTFLIGVRRKGGGIDDPKGDLDQARETGEAFLAANPDVQLHQMHDPNQDRLSLQYITYFRFKYRCLPDAYRRLLTERLKPGGVLIVSESTQSWPTTRVADRYFFQFGAVGGMTPDDYFRGGDKVAEYLARYGVDLERWDPPKPDGESPEAEWGFEPALMEDIEDLARERGLRVVRLSFEDPEDLSPLVADFYRDWYARRGLAANRLLAESFILLEPYWTLRTGSVPFWMTFNMRMSLDSLRKYLERAEPFDGIGMMLFPHGTESVGLPSIEEWRSVFSLARNGGSFLGVNEQAFPHHFSALARYYLEVSKLPARYPLPAALPFEDFERFCTEAGDRYPARLVS